MTTQTTNQEGTMTGKIDLMQAIAGSSTRFEAAIYVRALAANHATRLTCYSDAERLSIVERADILADSLERPYSFDGSGEDVPESAHPWRQWLRQAGYHVPTKGTYTMEDGGRHFEAETCDDLD